jgi:hypothetical protein
LPAPAVKVAHGVPGADYINNNLQVKLRFKK